MSTGNKIKISVLRRFHPNEVLDTSPVTILPQFQPFPACKIFEDGQEIIIDGELKMPENFCTSAWHSLYPSLKIMYYGGSFPWFEEEGVAVNACLDGLRPVIFKIERI